MYVYMYITASEVVELCLANLKREHPFATSAVPIRPASQASDPRALASPGSDDMQQLS